VGVVPTRDQKSWAEEVQIVLRQLRAYLMRKGPLIDFYHDGLRKAVRTKHLNTAARCHEVHSELASYFRKVADPAGDSTWASHAPHAVGEYPWQLLKAGQWAELEDTLTTFPFLQNKVRARGPAELLDDYEAVLATVTDGVSSRRPAETALSVAKALRRCIHVITHDADALAPQMLGRLVDVGPPGVRKLVAGMERWRPGCWLRPLTPCLVQPNTILVRRFSGHFDRVGQVAVLPGGRQMVTVGDSTLKLWDIQTGRLALPSQRRPKNPCLRSSIMSEQAEWSYMKEVWVSSDPARML
jgi:WD40 repeat protein